LLIIAYDEAEEMEVYALAEETKENAPEPTAIGTSAKKNKTQVKDTPAKTSDARVQVIQMLKNGIPVKEIASITGLKQYAIYKIRSEVM
jgi:DNA invertase Pin-like site-specific DNA recombinase